MTHFVGRGDALAALSAALDSAREPPARAVTVLVGGIAGMGKTALLDRFAGTVGRDGARAVRGCCWDAEQAPAFWPWIQVFRALRDAGEAIPEELAVVLGSPQAQAAGGDRIQIFDAAGRCLAAAAARRPLVVLLDDLQWADVSSLELLRFLATGAHPAPMLLAGAYRRDEPGAALRETLGALATAAEFVPLEGLRQDEVAELVGHLTGGARHAGEVYERSGGHPFFVRELAVTIASGGEVSAVPAAVREAIERRLTRLSPPCARLLEAAAVAGPLLHADVMAEVLDEETAETLEEAVEAGVLDRSPRFTHDLFREAVYASLPARRRLDLHHRVALAAERRRGRGGAVFTAELARHYAAAAPLAGPDTVLTWAEAAAREDRARYAFAEAAGHLARARRAIAEAGHPLAADALLRLLTSEADDRLRGGDPGRATALLDDAWHRAQGDPQAMGLVALGMDGVGTRFAVERSGLVAVLERAREALTGEGGALLAKVTAALARQLQHSVPADRPRAAPLAATAVSLARTLDDPGTLAECLLARHDVLWTPGTGQARAALAGEISELARRTGDTERLGQSLLLTAGALLEAGSPAFRAALAEFRFVTERLRQPRHDYVLRTREAALALLDGDIDGGERLVEEAAALGERIGEADTGNVRMSQLLEVVRARGEPEALRDTARAAVQWWVGAPVHAHAIAAGFLARAGDVPGARRELDTVTALGWRADRSYLRSVFLGELATAATAVADRELCELLLEEILPISDSCAVNAALVCFMGSHAHYAGLLCASLGRDEQARDLLRKGLDVHQRLGAKAWIAESLAALGERRPSGPDRPPGTPRLRRSGDLWEVGYRGASAHLRDSKGLRDLAVLLACPGTGVPAIDLAGSGPDGGAAGPVLDRRALAAYRDRLAELDAELGDASDGHDLGRAERAGREREMLLAELRRATRPGGASRALGSTAAERARKAVTARVREAIARIAAALPELGTHLDRTVVTGMVCAYEPGRDRANGRD